MSMLLVFLVIASHPIPLQFQSYSNFHWNQGKDKPLIFGQERDPILMIKVNCSIQSIQYEMQQKEAIISTKGNDKIDELLHEAELKEQGMPLKLMYCDREEAECAYRIVKFDEFEEEHQIEEVEAQKNDTIVSKPISKNPISGVEVACDWTLHVQVIAIVQVMGLRNPEKDSFPLGNDQFKLIKDLGVSDLELPGNPAISSNMFIYKDHWCRNTDKFKLGPQNTVPFVFFLVKKPEVVGGGPSFKVKKVFLDEEFWHQLRIKWFFLTVIPGFLLLLSFASFRYFYGCLMSVKFSGSLIRSILKSPGKCYCEKCRLPVITNAIILMEPNRSVYHMTCFCEYVMSVEEEEKEQSDAHPIPAISNRWVNFPVMTNPALLSSMNFAELSELVEWLICQTRWGNLDWIARIDSCLIHLRNRPAALITNDDVPLLTIYNWPLTTSITLEMISVLLITCYMIISLIPIMSHTIQLIMLLVPLFIYLCTYVFVLCRVKISHFYQGNAMDETGNTDEQNTIAENSGAEEDPLLPHEELKSYFRLDPLTHGIQRLWPRKSYLKRSESPVKLPLGNRTQLTSFELYTFSQSFPSATGGPAAATPHTNSLMEWPFQRKQDVLLSRLTNLQILYSSTWHSVFRGYSGLTSPILEHVLLLLLKKHT